MTDIFKIVVTYMHLKADKKSTSVFTTNRRRLNKNRLKPR